MGTPKARSGRLGAALRTPTGLLALVVLAVLTVLALLAPTIWGHQAGRVDIAHLLEGSSGKHIMGTDNLGHDILARVLVATRSSLSLAVLATLCGAAIGIPLGAVPTVLGRRAARMANAFIDFSVAFPALLLAIFTALILGAGATAAVLAIGVAAAPSFARLTQTLAASVAGSDYVAAARTLGVPRRRLLFRHVLPNVAEPLIMNTTIAIGYALLAVSGLSFLGLGVQPPYYDWGRLLNDGLPRIYVTPWATLGPSLAIVIAGLAFNGLGESLARAASTRSSATAARRPRPTVDVAARSVQPEIEPVLDVRGLTVTFPTPGGPVTPVRGISFSIAPGEIVGIVGESGSGKSLTALAVAQLVAAPGQVDADRIAFRGSDVAAMSDAEQRALLGGSMAMVFQDPATSFNPVLRVGIQLAEVAEVHDGRSRADAMARAVEALRRVRVSSPERRARQLPHELSGGMSQRAMIAMALMGDSQLIIADEPTSSLDVTVQQQILRLLRQVSQDSGSAALVISHDISVVTELCSRVLVMYAGLIVEDLDVATLLSRPAHPYTRALIASVPEMDTDLDRPLATIAGVPPEPHEVPAGCPFAARCDHADSKCVTERPQLLEVGPGRTVACWHPRTDPLSVARVETGSRG
jgi:peptide/nickel transport system permease protein